MKHIESETFRLFKLQPFSILFKQNLRPDLHLAYTHRRKVE